MLITTAQVAHRSILKLPYGQCARRPKHVNGVAACSFVAGGHDNADSRSLVCVSGPQLGCDPPSAEDCFHHLSVPGAHAVVDEDVEGGVDVGVDLQEPEGREERVLVAASRVQLRHEGQHQPA